MIAKVGLGALLLLTVWAYAPLRDAAFVYEDSNPLVGLDPGAPLDSGRGPWRGWVMERGHFVPTPRMLANVSMRVQGWTHATPRGYHAANLLIHLLNGVLLWAVLRPIGTSAALGGTLLFLLHPINGEAVAYVAARPDLLYASAVLAMLRASAADDAAAVLAVTVAGAAAILAKESAIVVVGLLPLWLVVRGRWSPRWWAPLGIWAVGSAWVVYRLVHVAARAGAARPWDAIGAYTAAAAHDPLTSAGVQAAALARLLALLVWPHGFSIDHDFDRLPARVALVALGALIAGAWAAWRGRHRAPWVAFAVAWLLVSLSIRFVLPMPDYMHEQHLYVPLLGVWIALAAQTAAWRSAWTRLLSGSPPSAFLLPARGCC